MEQEDENQDRIDADSIFDRDNENVQQTDRQKLTVAKRKRDINKSCLPSKSRRIMTKGVETRKSSMQTLKSLSKRNPKKSARKATKTPQVEDSEKLFEAKILSHEGERDGDCRFRVHYLGWADRNDAWLDRASLREEVVQRYFRKLDGGLESGDESAMEEGLGLRYEDDDWAAKVVGHQPKPILFIVQWLNCKDENWLLPPENVGTELLEDYIQSLPEDEAREVRRLLEDYNRNGYGKKRRRSKRKLRRRN